MSVAIDQGLPNFFHSHLQPNQAVTIARRTTVGKQVADAYVVAATSMAANWYGVDDPNDLLGGWLSLLQHRDDARLGRILALARHCGMSTPKSYVSRILQIHDKIFRPVTKEVTQVILGRETYLVTILSEAEVSPLAEERGIYEKYEVVSSVEKEQFLGHMSVADLDDVIEGGQGGPEASTRPTVLPFHRDYGLELGQTVRLDETSYAHRCAKCAGVWRSTVADPGRCAKSGCQILSWRILEEPFRTMRLEGRSVTPGMVRKARERKLQSRKGAG